VINQAGDPDHGAPLRIRSRVRDYEVEFDDSGGWAHTLAAVERTFVIVDENVLRLHGDGVLAPFRSGPIAVITASEDHKTFEAVAELCERAIERSAKRSVVLVSVGGGITQDVTGFMASILYRGVGWVYVPTTLLAMGDSCIGGKTSLNFGSRKNLLGTIYPPERVIVHTPFVSTLSGPDFASGMGEIVKLHMFGGPKAVDDVREALPRAMAREPETVRRVVRTSLEIKREFIEEDELDRGRRNLLNYGHCFGHALESATNFAIPHGLAVVIGMRLADLVAQRRGMLSAGEATARCQTLYLRVVDAWPQLDAAMRDDVVGAMAYDKKRTGSGLAVVVLGDGLSPAQLGDVTIDEAHAALAGLHERPPT
jgi:3-dehydroquinate synthase